MANVIFQNSRDYVSSLAKWGPTTPHLVDKIAEFKRVKTENPLQPYTKKDIRMISDGPFGRTIPNIRHVHLTQDLSLFYTLSGTDPHVFKLYGIYSHNESGTGDSANVNVQKSLAKRFKNMEFGQAAGDVTAAPVEPSGKFSATKSGKVDYTPKPKAPTPTQQVKATISNDEATYHAGLDMTAGLWPERNLKGQMANQNSIKDKLEVINAELAYLDRISRSHRLHRNQNDYKEALLTLMNFLIYLQRKK